MRGSLFTDPYSGHEVLHLEFPSFSCGATYEPRSTTSLYPWKSDCPHCQKGKSVDFPAHIRRHIELLCSRVKLPDQKIPTYSYSLDNIYQIVHWRKGDEQHINVFHGDTLTAQVHKKDLEDRIVWGDLRSKGLSRATRFLMSERGADGRMIAACANPLEQMRTERDKRPGRRTPCSKIEWQKILKLCEIEKHLKARVKV